MLAPSFTSFPTSLSHQVVGPLSVDAFKEPFERPTPHIHFVRHDLQRLTLNELSARGMKVMVHLGLTHRPWLTVV
jgi:hypothetical protein